jgi:hypothetical protein
MDLIGPFGCLQRFGFCESWCVFLCCVHVKNVKYAWIIRREPFLAGSRFWKGSRIHGLGARGSRRSVAPHNANTVINRRSNNKTMREMDSINSKHVASI